VREEEGERRGRKRKEKGRGSCCPPKGRREKGKENKRKGK